MPNSALKKNDFPLISSEALTAINADIVSISVKRYEAVKLALIEAYDQATGTRVYPKSLYIRGGNLYNKNLSKNVITSSGISAYLKNASFKEFYEGRESMLKAAVKNQSDCTGADCSGGVVGVWRKLGLSDSDMDATADMLCGNAYSTTVGKEELLPGDFVGRSGHIGLYVGGGYVVEWVGGSYGCQLTKLNKRVAYDFVQKKNKSLGAWTKFRRPKAFEKEATTTKTQHSVAKGNRIKVLGNSVNVRNGGSTSGKVLGVAQKGEYFAHNGRASSGWFHIEYKGSEGFISNRADLTQYVFTSNLKYGSKGESVKELKWLLNTHGAKLSVTNGNYLNSTRASVKRFQQTKNLVVDGIAGPKTIRALGGFYE